jgi:hypothetical protein
MPNKPILTTVFESDTRSAERRLWHLLLEGDRGCLVWWSEDCIDWNSPELPLTAKAKALTPVLQEMTSPLARLFLQAKRERDPIFIHYSQPSIQVDWLLESTVDGSTWLRRFSSFEAEHNRMAKTRIAWLKGLQDLGYSPQFMSSAELESGKLAGMTNAVLVLPNSWAASDKETTELGAFLDRISNGSRFHEVLAEGPAAVFDEHGKLRRGATPGSFLPATALNAACVAAVSDGRITGQTEESRGYLAERLKKTPRSGWLEWLETQLADVRREVRVPANARAGIHRFRIRGGRLIAIERNVDYQMSEELKQGGGNEALETPLKLDAALGQPAHVYDLRAGTYLGYTNQIHFTLDPWQPSLFALLREPLTAKSVVAELENLTSD